MLKFLRKRWLVTKKKLQRGKMGWELRNNSKLNFDYHFRSCLMVAQPSSSDEEDFLGFSDSDSEQDEASDAEISEDALTNMNTNETDDSDDEEVEQAASASLVAKDGTVWQNQPKLQRKTLARNLLKEKGGPHSTTRHLNEKETFKCFFNDRMFDIIVNMTNQKIEKHQIMQKQPKPEIKLVTPRELETFIGLIIYAGVHHSNGEAISELWGVHSLPLFRAAMSKNRFQEILRFIRFDDGQTRNERLKSDKAAAVSEVFAVLNQGLHKYYKPHECLTVDEQLFAYRGRFKFKQYIPSKPSKYGVKIFWINDSQTAYPLQGIIYKGKQEGAERQTNVGANIVLDLAKPYRGSGRNITADNFFVDLFLAEKLTSWKLTLVGTVRKSKRFLPPLMMPDRKRPRYDTLFAFREGITICSYVPKKYKAVVMLSTMHTGSEIESTEARKPSIVTYYNSTKGGTDTMDAMITRFTCKRKTYRWPLAFFFNMVDIGALAAYVVYKANNPLSNEGEPRRTFIKNLATQLCLPAILERRQNIKIYSQPTVKVAMDYFCLPPSAPQEDNNSEPTKAAPKQAIGICTICKEQNSLNRKTRRQCSQCQIPICAVHSSTNIICSRCS